jgi:hypothetical protein
MGSSGAAAWWPGCPPCRWSTLNRRQVHTCNPRLAPLDPRAGCALRAFVTSVRADERRPTRAAGARGAPGSGVARIGPVGQAGRGRAMRARPAFADSIELSLIRPLPRPAHKTRATMRSESAGCHSTAGRAGRALGARLVPAERAETFREAGEAARHLSGAAGQTRLALAGPHLPSLATTQRAQR